MKTSEAVRRREVGFCVRKDDIVKGESSLTKSVSDDEFKDACLRWVE
jgi:hypothetical protein